MATTTISDVLDGQLEAEKNYRQTLGHRPTDETKRIDRLIKILEKTRQHANGSRLTLESAEEMEFRAELERLSHNPEWTVNDIGELLHKFDGIKEKTPMSPEQGTT